MVSQVRIQIRLTLDQATELRSIIAGRKEQVQAYLLAKYTSEEEKDHLAKELDLINEIESIF